MYKFGSSLIPVVAAAVVVPVVVLFVFQRKLIFLPQAGAADPAGQGGKPQVLSKNAGPEGKDRYAAVFFEPRAPEDRVLVYFHGNADEIGWGGSYLGMYFRETYGLGLYGVEYPGYGLARPGSPSEKSINEAAEAMLRYLVEDIGIPRSRIVLFGQSIGCAVAVEMARRGFGSRLVLLAPFTSIVDIASSIYPFLGPVLKLAPWLVHDKFDNKVKAAEITLPTLVIHGETDEIVPFWMGETLAQKIPNSQLLPVRGMGHNDAFDNDRVMAKIASFAAEK